MTPILFDALLGLFSFAGLATLAVSCHQAEWRAVGSALLVVGVAVALIDVAAGGLLVLGVAASRRASTATASLSVSVTSSDHGARTSPCREPPLAASLTPARATTRRRCKSAGRPSDHLHARGTGPRTPGTSSRGRWSRRMAM